LSFILTEENKELRKLVFPVALAIAKFFTTAEKYMSPLVKWQLNWLSYTFVFGYIQRKTCL
jgi:hypothetical protein